MYKNLLKRFITALWLKFLKFDSMLFALLKPAGENEDFSRRALLHLQ
jgi:hypothetical protein